MPIRQIDDIIFDTQFSKTRLIGELFKEYYNKEVFNS